MDPVSIDKATVQSTLGRPVRLASILFPYAAWIP